MNLWPHDHWRVTGNALNTINVLCSVTVLETAPNLLFYFIFQVLFLERNCYQWLSTHVFPVVETFSALWWEAKEAPLAGEDAEPVRWGVQGTLGNSNTSECSSHSISISSSDILINYRPWNTDQKKGLVTINPFDVPASPWISGVEWGLGSGGEPSPARWDPGSGPSPGEENLEQCLCLTGGSYQLILPLAPGAHCRAVPQLSCMVLADWLPSGRELVLSSAKSPPWHTEAHAGGLWCSLTGDTEHLSTIRTNVWCTEPFWVMPIKCTACGTSWHLADCKVRCLLNTVFRLSR